MPHKWHARLSGRRMAGGTGFLVDRRHVVTCAHVVAGVEGDVLVSFPAEGLIDVPGRVVAPAHALTWQRGDPGDVAVVQLAKDVAIVPAKLAPLSAINWSGDAFRAMGFPKGFDGGTPPAELKINTDTTVGELSTFRATTTLGPSIRSGFSGAAIYLENTDMVFGTVVQATHNEDDGRTGLMMPLEVIARYWPAMLDLITMANLPVGAYRRLRSILLDYARHLDAEGVFRGMLMVGDWSPERPVKVQTVVDLVEWIGVGSIASADRVAHRLRVALEVILAKLDAAGQHVLAAWVTEHLGPRLDLGTPALQALVTVEIEPIAGASDAYTVIVRRTLGGAHHGEDVFSGEVPKETLRDKVERELERAVGPILEKEPIIEFVLPRGWLVSPPELDRVVDMWGAPPQFDTPLGWEHPVVVRDLDLARSPWNRSELKLRWKALRDAAHTDSATLITFMCKDEPRLNNRAFFKGRRDRSAVVLAAAPDGLPVLHRILNAAVPIILWPRRPCPDHDTDFKACAGARFSAELLAHLDPFKPDALPQKVMKLRQAAGDEPDGDTCGKDLTLIWDDPTRRPADDLGLA